MRISEMGASIAQNQKAYWNFRKFFGIRKKNVTRTFVYLLLSYNENWSENTAWPWVI